MSLRLVRATYQIQELYELHSKKLKSQKLKQIKIKGK